MPLPTLYQQGSLTYLNEKIDDIPVNFILRKIANLYFEKNKNIFLLNALTGSSKSTAFTISLFKYFKFIKKKVINLQPRVATVDNIIEELTTERWVTNMLDGHKIKLGEDIGFSTGKMKIKTKVPNGIMYYTYGSYFEKLLLNPEKILNKTGVIVFDEVHEDNLDLFLLLMKFKELLQKGVKLPILILTSATFDIDSFKKYFSVDDDRVFYVAGGVQYHKEIHFLEKDSKDLKKDVIEIIKKIPKDGHDILTFISSSKEIEDFKKLILETPELKDEIVIGLNREIIQGNKIDYQILYDKKIKERKIIFGNETVETGVTLNNLKYVIILGWSKSNDYIPYINSTLLYDEPSSKASYTQRAGRVGRKFAGVVFNMFTKEVFDKLKPYKTLSIFKMDISLLILQYLENFDLIKIVPKELVYDAIYKLYFLGFIALKDGNIIEENDASLLYDNIIFDKSINKYDLINFKLTTLGKLATKMYIPMIIFEINELKFIFMSYYIDINIYEVITILAMIKVFKYDKMKFDENNKDRNDYIYLLKEYNKILENVKNYLNENENINDFKRLEKIMSKKEDELENNNIFEVIYVKNSILEKLYELGFDLKKHKEYKSILNYDKEEMYLLNKCIYYSYFINYVKDNKYRNFNVKGNFKRNFICHSFKIQEDYLIPKLIVYVD
jgi:hypothetical protein